MVAGRASQDDSEDDDEDAHDETPEEGLERLTKILAVMRVRSTAMDAHKEARDAALSRAIDGELQALAPNDGVEPTGDVIEAATAEITRCRSELTSAKRIARLGKESLAAATAKHARAALAMRPKAAAAETGEEATARGKPRRSGRSRPGTAGAQPAQLPEKATRKAQPETPPPAASPQVFARQHSSPLHGDGSQRGPDDAHRASGQVPPSPSRLVIPGTPGSSRGQAWEERETDAYMEEKSLKAQLDMQAATTNAVAILEHAHARFPGIKEALLIRMTGQAQPGNLHLLPIAAIAALAQAQLQQNAALVVCRRSASFDANFGAARGKTLARLLEHEPTFDMQAARLIRNPTFPVAQWIAELIAGVIPLAAVALELIRQHHNMRSGTGADTDIYSTAEGMNLSDGNGLCIN